LRQQQVLTASLVVLFLNGDLHLLPGSPAINSGDNTAPHLPVFDLDGKIIKEVKDDQLIDPRNKANPSEILDAKHIQNFLEGISKGEKLTADIESGNKSTLLVQLGNIAQRMGRSLSINTETGHITDDEDARQLWSRTYEQGWEMKL